MIYLKTNNLLISLLGKFKNQDSVLSYLKTLPYKSCSPVFSVVTIRDKKLKLYTIYK